MLILNPKIQKLLQRKFQYSDEDITNMVNEYRNSIVNLVYDELLLFIDSHHLTDVSQSIISKSKQIKDNSRESVDILAKVYEEIFQVANKYPEAARIIEEKKEYLDNELNSYILSSLDEKGMLELLQIFEEDLIEIQKNEKILDHIESMQETAKP
jgi:glycyl-tRNA synthetase beta subunit